jgi:hypothetical protein
MAGGCKLGDENLSQFGKGERQPPRRRERRDRRREEKINNWNCGAIGGSSRIDILGVFLGGLGASAVAFFDQKVRSRVS